MASTKNTKPAPKTKIVAGAKPAVKGTVAKKTAAVKKSASPKSDIDRRWSILFFGIGVLFVLLAFIGGDAGWAFVRQNILFGAFGISGWLFGPMVIWWAVLVSLEKPAFPAIIKGCVFMLVFCGAALVFSASEISGLPFGEMIAYLHTTGAEGYFGGGVLSLVVGAPFLLLLGKLGARIVLVLFVALAVMLLTGVTPGDVARFFSRTGNKIGDKLSKEYEVFEDEGFDDNDEPAQEQEVQRQPVPANRVVPSAQKTNSRMTIVDIPLEVPAQNRAGRAVHVDIPLGAPTVRAPHDIDIGDSRVKIVQGDAVHGKVDVGPGGTFGMNARSANNELFIPTGGGDKTTGFASTGCAVGNSLNAASDDSEFGLGDYEPLVPFSTPKRTKTGFDMGRGAQDTPDILLFGEHDPYANLGGVNTRLPRGGLLDVEYIPKPDNKFDLFSGEQDTQNRAVITLNTPENTPFIANNAQNVQAVGTQPQAEPAIPQIPAVPREAPDMLQAQPQDASLEKLIDKASVAKNGKAEKDLRGADALGYDGVYDYPPIGLFDAPVQENNAGAREEMRKTADLLVNTLASFGVQTSILDVSRGPSVTRYEVQPQAGVKISRITGLSDDIALNLAAAGVRIEAPIPGKPAVGIEVPNKVKSTVPISGLLQSSAFAGATSPLSIALGKDIAGDVVVADLTKMPHLLIAGSTGSGKSVCVNSIIMSFLYKSSPEHVRLILIDPKVVELAEYNGIPHLLIPVVTEPKQAAKALGYATKMMEDRYHLFAEHGVRDIASYNKHALRTGKVETIPHIAIVIDELADLMMVAGKDVENYICRIAQKARAAGMHLIVATQRPSVDVITGLIKANIPSRIAFAVSSQVDSRTILDGAGAEKLLGMGDMLFMPIGANKPVRVQGTFVKDREISRVLNYIKSNAGACYDEEVLSEMDKISLSGAAAKDDAEDESADLLSDATFVSAVEMALEAGEISTSGLQRRLRLGYARAGRIVDQMERMGIVSEPNGSKPRQVLITRQYWQELVINQHE